MSKKTKLDISIIVSSGSEKFIIPCLGSLYENLKEPAQVFLTSNLASDSIYDEIKRKFPEVSIIKNNVKKGFAENHNNIIEKTNGEYILILNDDTIILENAIEKLINYMEKYPEVAVVGPKLLNPDLSLQHSTFYLPSLFGIFLLLSGIRQHIPFNRFTYRIVQFFYPKGKSRFWSHNQIVEVNNPGGPCVLVRRKAIKEVGLMDEATQFSGEDTEWYYRFKKKGWKVIFSPEAEIIHYGQATIKKEKFLTNEEIKGLLNFYRKHRNIISYYLLRIMIFSIFFAKYIFNLITHNKKIANSYFDIAKIALNPEKAFRGKRIFY